MGTAKDSDDLTPKWYQPASKPPTNVYRKKQGKGAQNARNKKGRPLNLVEGAAPHGEVMRLPRQHRGHSIGYLTLCPLQPTGQRPHMKDFPLTDYRSALKIAWVEVFDSAPVLGDLPPLPTTGPGFVYMGETSPLRNTSRAG